MQQKEILENLANKGLSTTEIGREINLSQTSTRYWLKKYGLKTTPYWSIENRFKYSDQHLLDIWSKSNSVNQFLLNLGVLASGGSWYHYKKRLEQLGVDFSNSTINGRKRGGQKIAALRNKETVKKRIRLPRATLKKSMDLANIPYLCNICGIFEWLNKNLLLHIHHKDEDKTNNHILNLEYLCPNCHSIQHYVKK